MSYSIKNVSAMNFKGMDVFDQYNQKFNEDASLLA